VLNSIEMILALNEKQVAELSRNTFVWPRNKDPAEIHEFGLSLAEIASAAPSVPSQSIEQGPLPKKVVEPQVGTSFAFGSVGLATNLKFLVRS